MSDTIQARSIAPLQAHTTERPVFVLVYQAGIANVFRTNADVAAQRVFQGDFRGAEMLCRGAGLAGAKVQSLQCNRAGDISLFREEWSDDLESAPFSDKFCPVNFG